MLIVYRHAVAALRATGHSPWQPHFDGKHLSAWRLGLTVAWSACCMAEQEEEPYLSEAPALWGHNVVLHILA